MDRSRVLPCMMWSHMLQFVALKTLGLSARHTRRSPGLWGESANTDVATPKVLAEQVHMPAVGHSGHRQLWCPGQHHCLPAIGSREHGCIGQKGLADHCLHHGCCHTHPHPLHPSHDAPNQGCSLIVTTSHAIHPVCCHHVCICCALIYMQAAVACESTKGPHLKKSHMSVSCACDNANGHPLKHSIRLCWVSSPVL